MIRQILCGMIRCYQIVIATHMPPSCRFLPSCSQYALEAIQTHGALRGIWLGTKRIGRCHPWGSCGFDPVPEVEER